MFNRIIVCLGVLAIDLVSKWLMYDPTLLNPGISRFDGWMFVGGIALFSAIYLCIGAGMVFARGIAGLGCAIWLGADLGQASQFLATGSVSDWIPVGSIGGRFYWTNLADIASTVGAVIVLVELGRVVMRERHQSLNPVDV